MFANESNGHIRGHVWVGNRQGIVVRQYPPTVHPGPDCRVLELVQGSTQRIGARLPSAKTRDSQDRALHADLGRRGIDTQGDALTRGLVSGVQLPTFAYVDFCSGSVCMPDPGAGAQSVRLGVHVGHGGSEDDQADTFGILFYYRYAGV